ncbi:MAG: GAF domain-containing protein [Nitrospirae bacterium]|nr:GAF domain-containing protein [Nitrospirota bacterium]
MNTVFLKEAVGILRTFDSLDTPVLLIDEAFTVISCNESARIFFQYEPDEMAGRTLDLLVIPDRRHAFRIAALRRGAPRDLGSAYPDSHFMTSAIRKNGDFVEAKVSVIPCQENTGAHKLVVLNDISEHRKLQRKAFQRTKELSILKAFAEILAQNEAIEAIMQNTVDMLLGIMEVEGGWIYLLEPDSNVLHLRAEKSLLQGALAVRELGEGECIFGKVFASGMPLLVERASQDPRVTSLHTGVDGVESVVAIPIRSKGIFLGVLGLATRREAYFTSMDTQLLVPIGNMLGVAMENIRLIEQLQKKMNQIELINELSGIVNSSLSIGTIFRIMVSEIRKLIDYDRASLLLYNEKEDNLLIFALDTDMQTIMKKGVRAPIEGTSAGWVVRHNKPWISHDLSATEFTHDKKLLREGIRSTISIPLYHDKILGVFNFDSSKAGNYSEKDLEILLPVAKHISIALENALLFEEISREKKEWEKTFDAITDMVWIEDSRQRVVRANYALLVKTGLTVVEAAGKSCTELFDLIGVADEECICAESLAELRPCFRELKGPGGSIFHFWTYPLIDDEGKLYALVHYLKDVTAQKRLEQQLVRSDKLASLGTLVAGIAHEINNPLGIIAGYAEALMDRSRDESLLLSPEFEDFPEYLQTIHNEIFRCKGILRSLLDFARPTGGTFREIDMNELVKEVILLVNHRAKRLNHDIGLQLDRNIPKIHAAPGNLRQVFMNLIINSLYFTPEGGRITITTGMDGDTDRFGQEKYIKVTVSDTGAGIDPEIIGKIFDPFFTSKPVGEGTGLGLAISHKIIEEHNGSIDVMSNVGEGTSVIIRLPLGAE